MLKKYAFKILMISQILLLAGFIVLGGQVPVVHAAATKIMPLGDSITGSPGCWRALLWTRLQNAGYTNIDFVGSQPPQGCAVPYDGDSEGHGGILATNMADQNQLPAWLTATNPDIVMMHLGTNDVWSGRATSVTLAAFTTLVNQMRANNPNMKIIVAQILPMNPSGCSTCAQGVIDLNAAIPAWASSLSTAQSPISVVDQWTGFNTATDTADGVHPNDLGNQKMSDKWYPALSALLTVGGNTATLTKTNPPGSPTVTLTKTMTSLVSTPTLTRTPTLTSIPPTRTPTSGASPTGSVTAVRTSTRTPTPTGSLLPFTSTVSPTRTPTPTGSAPVPTRTITPTAGTGGCSPVTSTITAPFTFDGAGAFCWQSSNFGSFINSWNLASLSVNGVNYTNVYLASGSYPAKINGFWYVGYSSTVAWGHFEAK